MTVVGLRRQAAPPPRGVAAVYPRERLPELLERSDVVVLSLPLTCETRGLIGAAELARLKPGSYLINVARGELVDEGALAAALRSGHLAGAAGDAFIAEPLPPFSPLYDAPNLLISPHMAPNAAGWQRRALALFVENFERWQAGRRLRNVVDKARGY
jgi:phosphoglycerate dehydrogenase-like enzyme